MIRPPRPNRNLTIDMKSVLSGGTNAGKTPRAIDSASYLSALTASQYAEMFPDYFRRGRPDIGISASGIIPGRQLPSAAAMPGVGQPATAAARAARRAQTSGDQPGTGTSPGTSPGTAPVWQGGTPEVNRSGNLPTRAKGGHPYLAQQRAHLFEKAEKDPQLKAMIMGLLLKENNKDPTSILEAMANRAIMNNQTLEQQMKSGFFGPYNRGEVSPVYGNKAALDAWERVKGGSDQLEGRTDQGLQNEHRPAEQHEARHGQGTARIKKINGEWYSDMGTKGVNWRKAREQDLKKWEEANPGWNRDDIENTYLPPIALLDKRNLATAIAEQAAQKEKETKVIPGRQLPTGTGSVASIIANAESGNKGYNAYNKGTTSSGGLPNIDFSTLTVGELMAMQSRRDVFAVGKYQIIPSTMKAAISALKIPPNEKFTPELQERIFSQYLTREKRPAIENYIKGSGNLDDARRSIAQEWAGIAYNGKSWYAGDSAGNAAHARTEGEMRAALERARTVYAELIKQGVDKDTAYAQALSTGAQQAPAAKSRKVADRVYIGDSVAEGLGRDNDNATSYTKVGAAPTAILADVKKIAREALDGKDVVLSAGLLNDPKQASVVRDIIREVKDKGGNVLLVGGPTEGSREDLAGVNEALAVIAKEEGVRFLGGYKSSDGVHPLNYASVDSRISPVTKSAMPVPSAIPADVIRNRATGVDDLYEIAQSKRTDVDFGEFRASNYNCGRGTGAVVDAMFGSNYTRGGIGGNANEFALGQRKYKQFVPAIYQQGQPLPEDYLKDTTKIPIGAVIASAGGSKGDGHIQVWNGKEWVSDFRQGQRNSVAWSRSQSYHSHTLYLPKPEAYSRLDPQFLERQDPSGATRDIMKQHGIQPISSTEPSSATPTAVQRATKQHAIDQLWTSLERAPTTAEIETGIKNGIKYFDFDMTKDGAQEAADRIKELGGQVVSYNRGVGNTGWKEKFRSKDDVLAEMLQDGRRLQHLDNQDQMSEADFNSIINTLADKGIKVVPKNALKYWNNYLKSNPEYMKDVPYAIIENAHTYDKKVLDEFNKSTGGNKAISLGWQNQKVAESVLKNTGIPSMVSPNPEVPTKDGGEDGGYHFANAKKIKENAHGGTMQTSGEPVIMVDRLSGRTLGSVSKGEKVSFDETGKLTVIPGHRTDPNAITDNSRKLADAARHASTMAQDEYNVEGTASMVPTQQYQPQYQVGHQNINPEAPFAPSFGRHMARSSDITKSENHFSTAGMTDRTTSV